MKGDLNAKIVNNIPGNKEPTPNGERQLKRIFEKYYLNLISANESKCKSKWTREQGEDKSIIDCVVTSQEYMEIIKNMEEDEEKGRGVYKKEQQNKQMKKTCSNTLITMLC